MRHLSFAYERWWTRHFLAPHFDALGPGALVSCPSRVEVFGAGVTAGRHLHLLASRDLPIRFTAWPAPGGEARIALGDCVLVCGGARILAAQSVTIGDGCMIAHGATITDCDWHGLYDRVTAVSDTRPVILEPNVWLGDNCYVGKGVTIGENSIVGAHAVVTRSTPATVVLAGNPAEIIKELDPDAPRVTRLDLYRDPDALVAFLEDAWRHANNANTTLGWLKSALAPSRSD